jgi:CPA2 family monovalent cation:H+ antiporter-2
MDGEHEILSALSVAFCAAGVTAMVFRRIRQPIVLGYVFAGMIIGPHIPVPLVADTETIETLSDLGVILLMFSIGLEFNLGKLFKTGTAAAIAALFQSTLVFCLGFATGRLFGWTTVESVFTGALIAISSTTIIAKAFDEQSVARPLRETVIGILIVEDLIAIVLMAALTTVASGAGLSADKVVLTVGRLTMFLAAIIMAGLLVVPRLIRSVVNLDRPETTTVVTLGLCFAIALLTLKAGYSVALGAFLAGALVAESGHERTVDDLIRPVKDIFAALFFVSVGMLFDPVAAARHWQAIVTLTAVVLLGKVAGVSVGVFLTGSGTRTSIQAGMSLAQIGEFSFIIAGLGSSLGVTRDFIYPVAVSVSVVTTFLTPWLIRMSGPVSNLIDRTLPAPLQTFSSLYGAWIENLRHSSRQPSMTRQVRGLIGLLSLDTLLLVAVIVGGAESLPNLTPWLEYRIGVHQAIARSAAIIAIGAVAAPFCFGVISLAKRLGLLLARVALPNRNESSKIDLSAAPRSVLTSALQLALVLAAGAVVIAVTAPIVPGLTSPAALIVILGILGVAFWHKVTDLSGHVRAGAQLVIEALSSRTQQDSRDAEVALKATQELLPGFGDLIPVRLPASSPAVGNTLRGLNLRGATGATVLAVVRRGDAIVAPSAKEVLNGGDFLVLAGTSGAVEEARRLLSSSS